MLFITPEIKNTTFTAGEKQRNMHFLNYLLGYVYSKLEKLYATTENIGGFY
jgi:hypothetical protein